MTDYHWKTLKFTEADGRTPVTDSAAILAALAMLYRADGLPDNVLLARTGELHEKEEDTATWGPLDEDIDWRGFAVIHATQEEVDSWEKLQCASWADIPQPLAHALCARANDFAEAINDVVEVRAPSGRLVFESGPFRESEE